jgi:hypothetical protein
MSANIKKLLSSQIDPNKPYKQIHFIFVNVYHFINLSKLLTQYTSYEVDYIAKSSTPK